jgi:hypothetical protein
MGYVAMAMAFSPKASRYVGMWGIVENPLIRIKLA